MRTTALILFAALTGCSSFRDPTATAAEVRECKVEARNAREEHSILSPMRFGVANTAFDSCMAAKGYRTNAKG